MARKRSPLELKEAIKEELNSRFGHSLKVDEWDFLVKKGYLGEIELNPSTRERVLAEMETKVRDSRRKDSYSKRGDGEEKVRRLLSQQEAEHSIERSAAVSCFVALEARKDVEVRLFRSEVLGNTLLPLEEVPTWIQQQVQKDGPPTTWLREVPLPQSKVEELAKLLLGFTPETKHFSVEIPVDQIRKMLSLRGHVLQYAVPHDEWAWSVPTSMGGILDRLRQLSERLEERYAWMQAQATSFVLTDRPPLIDSVSSTLKMNSHPLFDRIVLEVDPLERPEEAIKQYENLRKEIMAVRRRKRSRTLSEKHIQLAVFDVMRPENETWPKKMAEWNKTHQANWRYTEVRNFSDQCKKARYRLLLLPL